MNGVQKLEKTFSSSKSLALVIPNSDPKKKSHINSHIILSKPVSNPLCTNESNQLRKQKKSLPFVLSVSTLANISRQCSTGNYVETREHEQSNKTNLDIPFLSAKISRCGAENVMLARFVSTVQRK